MQIGQVTHGGGKGSDKGSKRSWNHQGQNGDTALMWGFKKISKNNTLNLSSLNFNFFTKSYIACGLGYTDVVNLLIQAGADVNLKQLDGWTALMSGIKYFLKNIF